MCAKAAAEVVASREAIANLLKAREVDNQVIERQKLLIETQGKLVDSKDAEIKSLRDIVAVYDKQKGTTVSFLFGLIKYRHR